MGRLKKYGARRHLQSNLDVLGVICLLIVFIVTLLSSTVVWRDEVIHKVQLKELIETTLKEYNLYSKEAHELVYGTIIQESRRGTYLRQGTKNFDINKHAIGIGQVEKTTFQWLQSIYVSKYPELATVKFRDLEYNLRLSILFVRLRYLIDPEPLPKTLDGQARYWKRVYNTKLGKGTPEKYMTNYRKYS